MYSLECKLFAFSGSQQTNRTPDISPIPKFYWSLLTYPVLVSKFRPTVTTLSRLPHLQGRIISHKQVFKAENFLAFFNSIEEHVFNKMVSNVPHRSLYWTHANRGSCLFLHRWLYLTEFERFQHTRNNKPSSMPNVRCRNPSVIRNPKLSPLKNIEVIDFDRLGLQLEHVWPSSIV